MKYLNRLVSAALMWSCLAGFAWAADTTWEVKSGDTLGLIVAKQYPGYRNRDAIMKEILKRNQANFPGQDINRMTVGKTLTLPDASKIPDLTQPAEQASGSDAATLEKLKKLEAEYANLKETLSLLETENAGLQKKVKEYEDAKQARDTELEKLNAKIKELEASAAASGKEVAPTGAVSDLQKNVADLQAENAKLTAELEAAHKTIDSNEKATNSLKTELADMKRANEKLSNDLLQAQTAVATATKKSSSFGLLPWVIAGLLALLMLPLLWLLLRARPQAAPVRAVPEVMQKKVALAAIPNAPVAADAALSPPSVAQPSATVAAPAPSADDGVAGTLADEDPDTDLKLDIARAYLDIRDSDAAAEILKEVLTEGGSRQRQEAREILSFIS